MYYWDSYWIIRGLLLCDMYQTAKGMIENMLWLVRIYGHMPNGSRKYYLQRSQPPLLIQMAATYHSCTKDHAFIRDNLKVCPYNFFQRFKYYYITLPFFFFFLYEFINNKIKKKFIFSIYRIFYSHSILL